MASSLYFSQSLRKTRRGVVLHKYWAFLLPLECCLVQKINARRDKLLAELNGIKVQYHEKEKAREEYVNNLTNLRKKLEGMVNRTVLQNEHLTNVQTQLAQFEIATPVPLPDITWNLNDLLNQCENFGTFQDVSNKYRAMRNINNTMLQYQLSKPSGLRVIGGEKLYVADCWNGRVQVVDIVHQKGIGEVGKGTLVWPHSVDVYDQVLYTSDYGLNTIAKFKNDEFILRSKEGELNSPFGIIVDENEVYVADNGNNRIAVLSLDLEFIREFGKTLKTPRDVNINQNRVFVADNSDAQNVHIFSKTGDLLSSIISLGNKTETIFLCFDKFNNILISHGSANKIHIYTIEGQLIHSISCVPQNVPNAKYTPTGVEITQDNKIIIVDFTSDMIVMYVH